MIRLGQIGLNYGLKVQIPAFSQDPRFELVGVCSANIDNAKAIKSLLSLELATDDPEELFSLVDAVSIALPPKEQAIILPKAIERGLHVFFEKPLGYIPHENIKIKNSQALMVDFEFLEIDVWKNLKELIEKNEIGKILHAEILWNVETYAVSNNLNSWKTDPDLSGGVLNNFASHSLHYIEQFMGEITQIYVKAVPANSGGEKVAYIYLQFKSGASASLCLSTNTYKGSGHFLEFTGSRGTALLKNNSSSTLSNFSLEVFKKSGENYRKNSNIPDTKDQDSRIPVVGSLVRRFGDWIETGDADKPGLLEALRVEKLLRACRESINEMKEVKIDL